MARPVFASKKLEQAFDKLRQEVLCLPRNKQDLAEEVVKMRLKMREHLGSQQVEIFNLKQDVGGIADIEFLAQYLSLAYSQEFPAMAVWSDNIRIFETAQELQILSKTELQQLIQAYITYRNRGHQHTLKCKKAEVPAQLFTQEREQVIAIWQKFLG